MIQELDSEIQLVCDGDGLAVIGSNDDIEKFLVGNGLDNLPSKDLGLGRLGKTSHIGSIAMQSGSTIANGSGRWVQITEKSASQISKFGLMKSKDSGLSLGVVQDSGGKIKGIVEFAHGPGQVFANPAILAGAAGVMAQLAIQKQMEEVVDYLREIDEKVHEIIRSQKDSVLADVLGTDLIIQEAWAIRNEVGLVSDVTWSKVQGTSLTIARSQAYALRQLNSIAENLHDKKDADEIVAAANEAEQKVREWLEILARSLQLQDMLSLLELDRVLDSLPEQLDKHRLGLNAARCNRQELIAKCTFHLLSEMDETVKKANSKVLFNPFKSPAAVHASNQVAAELHHFRAKIGIETDYDSYKPKGWMRAATEAGDKMLATTTKSIDNVRAFSIEASEKTIKSVLPDHKIDVETNQEIKPLKSAGDFASTVKSLTADAANNAISSAGDLTSGAANIFGSLFQQKEEKDDGLNPMQNQDLTNKED